MRSDCRWRLASLKRFSLSAISLLSIACSGADPVVATSPAPEPSAPSASYVPLDPRSQAIRVSMALRGLRPTADELAAVDADPAALATLTDAWLASDDFAASIRDMHADQLAVRDDVGPNAFPAVGALAAYDQSALYASRTDEPLRLAERIVTEGRPYSELVTADWMMTDAIVAAAYGLPYDAAGPAWQESHWTDGRPAAGILASSQLFRRFVANAQDFNRARADTLTRFLVCAPISERPLDLSGVTLPAWDSPETVADALWTMPACVNCHQSLDPIAASLFGFPRRLYAIDIENATELGCPHVLEDVPPEDGTVYTDDKCYPLRHYRPENETLWVDFGLRAPGWYGTPVDDLAGLGAAIADDPRFVSCAVRRFVGWFEQLPPATVPDDVVQKFEAEFRANDLDARALVRSIVLSDAFLARASETAWTPGVQNARPEQLRALLAQTLDFAWTSAPSAAGGCEPYCYGDVDLLTTDDYGFRGLLGGVDGSYAFEATYGATPQRTLAWERAASDAAATVIARELALPRADRALLGGVEGTESGGDAVRATLADLGLRLFARPLDAADTDAIVAVFDAEIARSGEPAAAWTLALTALLLDPRTTRY